MKISSDIFQPKVSKASAVQLPSNSVAQAVSITDNRPTAILQRKIQAVVEARPRQSVQKYQKQVSPIGTSKNVLQRVIHKGKTINSQPIGLKGSDFYKNLPTDDHRCWAVVLNNDEHTHYTKATALIEIQDRIDKKLPVPVMNAQEDPQMRILIEKHQSGHSRKQDRQVHGMHGLYETGTQTEKDQMIAFLGGPANAKGFTESVRQGELNETLLTSDTKDAALRSLNAVSGITPSTLDINGKEVYWTDYQSITSYPTNYFTFPNTTTDSDGNEIQDTHINGSTYRKDSTGKKHLTVGSTSDTYHFGASSSLSANYRKSTKVVSHARRNAKFHKEVLASRDDILAVDASSRARQIYRTKSGRKLYLNNQADLEEYAEHVQIHTDKVVTDLNRQAKRLRNNGNESESEVSDYENELEMDVDSEDEAAERIKKRKKKKKLKTSA